MDFVNIVGLIVIKFFVVGCSLVVYFVFGVIIGFLVFVIKLKFEVFEFIFFCNFVVMIN